MNQLTFELEDAPGLVGRTFEVGEFQISRTERDVFEAITMISQAYPEPSLPEFPVGIVEGFHVLSLIDALSTRAFRFNPERVYGFNYGLDRVRFIEPMRIGEPLRFGFEVTEVREKGEGYLIRRDCRIEPVEASARISFAADWLSLILPSRGPGG